MPERRFNPDFANSHGQAPAKHERPEREDVRRTLKKALKQARPNREERAPRRRDWLRDLETLQEDEIEGSERVMPRGEQERRRRVFGLAQAIQEQAETAETLPAEVPAGLRGMVVEVSTGLCRVALDAPTTNPRTLLCTLRGALSAAETGYTNVVAVGDDVIVSESDPSSGVIEQVLPRRSVLARPDVFASHLKQAIVANADQLLIVASWRHPHLWLELIDRYLIAAEHNNLVPIICINKIDLAEDRTDCATLLAPYRALGVTLLTTSAQTGEGIGALRQLLTRKKTVLAGLSGVGKSTLLSVVQPGLNLRTHEVSATSGNGQHTTTQVNLWRLEAGGCVVDTPGIREFGLSDLRRQDLISFYPEVAALAAGCKFSNCSHTHEPACAVREAASHGAIAAWRYENYLRILATLPA